MVSLISALLPHQFKLKALALVCGVVSINLWSPMDEDLSNRASILPWIWVIEALAHFKQVDISVLHGILNPNLSQKKKTCYSNSLFFGLSF